MRHFEADIWEQPGSKAAVTAGAPTSFLADHLAPLTYDQTIRREGESTVFHDEKDFWRACRREALGAVRLKGFRISDWFPRAPGVYWSSQGEQSRQYAAHSERHDKQLGRHYAVHAKMHLVEEGGLGTVRFTPKLIDGERCWLGLACAGPQAAGAVPLAIPDRVLRASDLTWGDTVELTGEVRYLKELGLDDVAAAVHHATPVLVFAEEIRYVRRRDRHADPLILTPVVLFETDEPPPHFRLPEGHRVFGYTFASCSPAPGELDAAAEWMSLYVAKHQGKIVTNFDETFPTLADAPLSYQRLVARTEARTYIESLTLHGSLEGIFQKIGRMTNINNVTLGNGVVIHGSFTVANSIRDSYNRGDALRSGDLRALLTALSGQVAELVPHLPSDAAEKVADDLATLTKELSRTEPRPQWWRLSLNGLKDAAKAVGDIGTPVLKTVAVLAPMLAGR
jgi:hypothetical protein